MTDADAEQMETQHWVGSAVRSGYWTQTEADALLVALEELGRMLGSMIRQADNFCSDTSSLREDSAIYFSIPPSEH